MLTLQAFSCGPPRTCALKLVGASGLVLVARSGVPFR